MSTIQTGKNKTFEEVFTMYQAVNIFTGERSPMFFSEEEMDEYINGYNAVDIPARFDVYHDGRLIGYSWNKAYYNAYMSNAFWICENYNKNNQDIVVEQRNKRKRWM